VVRAAAAQLGVHRHHTRHGPGDEGGDVLGDGVVEVVAEDDPTTVGVHLPPLPPVEVVEAPRDQSGQDGVGTARPWGELRHGASSVSSCVVTAT
jgi:hypothetical protein